MKYRCDGECATDAALAASFPSLLHLIRGSSNSPHIKATSQSALYFIMHSLSIALVRGLRHSLFLGMRRRFGVTCPASFASRLRGLSSASCSNEFTRSGQRAATILGTCGGAVYASRARARRHIRVVMSSCFVYQYWSPFWEPALVHCAHIICIRG